MARKKITPVEDVTETPKPTETTGVENELAVCNCESMISSSSNFNYGFEESLIMDDISERNLYIQGEITAEVFHHIYYFVTKFNAEDAGVEIEERKPIKLHISTMGGSAWDGLGICELLRNSITPVIGICTSYALSMGFYIFISCDVRYATENAFLLNHEGLDGDYGHPSKIKDYINFSDRLNERLNKIIIHNSNLTARDLKDTERIENYIFADEAKDMGIVDFIIGRDCTLDEIL